MPQMPDVFETRFGAHASYWSAHSPYSGERWPVFSSDTEAHVAIIGGGYTGLSTALHLAEAGIDCLVLEAQTIGWGASGRNNGNCVPDFLRQTPKHLRRRYGEDGAKRAMRFIYSSAAKVAETVAKHDIACNLERCGMIYAARSAGSATKLKDKAAELARQGLDISELPSDTVPELTGSPLYRHGGFILEDALKLDPLAYCRGLAKRASGNGAQIYEHSRITGLECQGRKWRLLCNGHAVTAQHVVLAQNMYQSGLHPALSRSNIPVHAFMAATSPLPNTNRPILPGGHMLTDDAPIAHLVTRFEDRLIFPIVGAQPFFKNGAVDSASVLRKLRTVFPQLGEDTQLEYIWQGVTAMHPDEIPALHMLENGLWAAQGYWRGVGGATAMGAEIAKHIAGEPGDRCLIPVTKPRRVHAASLLGRVMPLAAKMALRF